MFALCVAHLIRNMTLTFARTLCQRSQHHSTGALLIHHMIVSISSIPIASISQTKFSVMIVHLFHVTSIFYSPKLRWSLLPLCPPAKTIRYLFVYKFDLLNWDVFHVFGIYFVIFYSFSRILVLL